MNTPVYESVFTTPVDVSLVAVGEALGKAGFEFPVLHVAPCYAGDAIRINQWLGHVLNIEIIRGAMNIDEWWVEFNGKCVGSEGA